MTTTRSSLATRTLAGASAAAWCLAASPLFAQIPDKFTNLQVLPKDITKIELVRTMRNWAGELGARCTHCHVGPDDLQGMDFAIDTKPTKRAAREMIKMVHAVNAAVKALPARDEARDGVTCYTCHRRQARPPLALPEALLRASQAGDGTAAVGRYRELRQAHLGDGTYDFGPPALGMASQRLVEAGRLDDALAVARENAAQHGDNPNTHVLVGDVLSRKGDKAGAAEAYRKALALDPKHFGAARGLKELEKPAAPR
jgi:tetratricopeptide (TPR) repeat protein